MKILKLLDSLNTLPGNFRTEKSVKFVAGQILNQRWLFSTSIDKLPSILQLLERYDLPRCALTLQNCLKGHANFVHVGMEHSEERTLIKLYLESENPEATEDCRFIACKWASGESSSVVSTMYREVANATPGIVRDKILPMLKQHDVRLDSLHPLIESLGAALFPADLRLLHVRDQNSSRISYDLNFYDSDFLVEQCEELLLEATRHCHISQTNMAKALSEIRKYCIGHIALGFTAEQRFFITLYYSPE